MHVKKEVLCCKFLIFNNNCNFVCFRVFLLYTSIESIPLAIYMVHDYSFFGSTADFVIKNEHLGVLPDLAIFKRQRRLVEI
jgi:hypothetical protein